MKINFNDTDYEYYIIDEDLLINHKVDNNIEAEECEWKIEDIEDFIDDLINWISEATSYSTKVTMKKDLKYLIWLKDDYIFSSTTTNEYIAKSDNETEFNNICKDFITYKKYICNTKT